MRGSHSLRGRLCHPAALRDRSECQALHRPRREPFGMADEGWGHCRTSTVGSFGTARIWSIKWRTWGVAVWLRAPATQLPNPVVPPRSKGNWRLHLQHQGEVRAYDIGRCSSSGPQSRCTYAPGFVSPPAETGWGWMGWCDQPRAPMAVLTFYRFRPVVRQVCHPRRKEIAKLQCLGMDARAHPFYN